MSRPLSFVLLLFVVGCGDTKPQKDESGGNVSGLSADERKADEEAKATAKRQAAKTKSEREAAKLAGPPMTLPPGPRPAEVIGRSRRDVRKLLPADMTVAGNLDVATIGGTLFQVTYAGDVAVKMTLSLTGYSNDRDSAALVAWLGVDFSTTTLMNGRKVGAHGDGTTVHVYDEAVEAVTRAKARAAEAVAQAKAQVAQKKADLAEARAQKIEAARAAKAEAARPAEEAKAEIARQRSARKEYASNLDQAMLKDGNNATVRADGTVLRIDWVLCNRATMYQLIDGAAQQNLKSLGFTRVVCSDGFYSTTSVNLEE